MKIIYNIRPREYWMCPICRWRTCFGRRYFRQHMKDQHQIRGNQLKLLKP